MGRFSVRKGAKESIYNNVFTILLSVFMTEKSRKQICTINKKNTIFQINLATGSLYININ